MNDAKFESGRFSVFGDMTLQIFSMETSSEQVTEFGYLPPENGSNLNKVSFYVQNRFPLPKIDPLCQLQQFSSRGKFFISKIF